MRQLFWSHAVIFGSLLVSVAINSGCSKENDPEPSAQSGKVIFEVDHRVDGQPLVENDMKYINTAGNEYLITGLKYFISDVTFYKSDGTSKIISDWEDIFYIDEDIAETKRIQFFDAIPAGEYDSVSFIFGISEEKNKSFMFVNPPEVNMAWPQVLGGGYHYLMLDGKWKDVNAFVKPFNFHLGIGQLYRGSTFNVDSIYAFVQNYFRVNLPGSAFSLSDQQTKTFTLTMNLEKWFEGPNLFDFNHWGGAIMQNQPAMQAAKENGWDVFSISTE